MPGNKLDSKTTDRLFDRIGHHIHVPSQPRQISIHFGDLQFVSASGLTWLIAMLCGLSQAGVSLRIVAPNNPEVCAWLQVMRFFDYCQNANIEIVNYTPQSVIADKEEVFLEVTPIVRSSDVSRITDAVVGRLAYILQSHLGYDDRDVHNVSSAMSEACLNICDHSGGEGVVAIQRHTSGAGVPFVAIGVADAGIGIRASLNRSHPEMASWSHERTIHSALQKGVSGRPDEDRGLGLPHILNIIHTYNGRLQIRSGDTRLSVVDNMKAHKSADFPGTQLCISLSTKTPSQSEKSLPSS